MYKKFSNLNIEEILNSLDKQDDEVVIVRQDNNFINKNEQRNNIKKKQNYLKEMYPIELAKLAYERLQNTKSQIAREYRNENRYYNKDMFKARKYGYLNPYIKIKIGSYYTFNTRLQYSDKLRKKNINNQNLNRFHLYHPNHQVHQ